MASSTSTLGTVAWRNIVAHKLRLALTVLAVLLGTAFITGAFVFTASLDKAFKGALTTAYDGVDVVVSAPANDPSALGPEQEAKLAAYPGVRTLNIGNPTSGITATGSDGKAIQTSGAPSLGLPYYPPEQAVSNKANVASGHAPASSGEVVINETTAKKGNLQVGDSIKVVTANGQASVKVVGIADTSVDDTGWLAIFFTADQWRELYSDNGNINMLSIGADSATDPVQLAADLAGAFPSLKVEAGSTLADQASESISNALSFVNYFLVAFGLIGLLVGIFIISNTFTMLVTQRTKEFALLRALGASRRQLTVSVLLEALIVGLIGSALGVAAGFALTQVLFLLMGIFGVSMPGAGLTVTASAVIVPLIVGVAITVIAAWAPAARAGAVPPVEAMRSGDQTSSNNLGTRTWWGGIVGAAALALIMFALQWDAATSSRAIFVGIGAAGAIGAVWLLGPALSIPLTGGLGRILGAPFGAVGKLAATNSGRNPRRTATTSFALTLGLALVTTIGMFGMSMKAAVDEWSQTNLTADFVLSPPIGAHAGLPKGVAAAVTGVNGVDDVATLSIGSLVAVSPEEATSMAQNAAEGAAFGPGTGNVTFFDGDFGTWFGTNSVSGSLDLSAPDAGIIISQSVANQKGWHVGTHVSLIGKSGVIDLPVTGVFADTPDPARGIIAATDAVVERVGAAQLFPMQVYIQAASAIRENHQAMADLRSALGDATADYIVVQVMTAEEFAGVANSSIDVMLGIVYALLALAVVTSILGIINTVALSVVERRQEIGMLRAVGMQRSGIRRMIRLEAVQISIFGAVMGVLLGLGLGWALLTVLKDEGLSTIAVPWVQLIIMLLGSALVGVVAALAPGQQAAKTPPLAAIADE